MTTALKAKKELLASKVSNLVSDTNENLLRVNLSKFFTDLEVEIQKALLEYWSDTMLLQGQIDLILTPIHEKQREYFELIMHHKLDEFKRGETQGKRLVERALEKYSMKAAKTVGFTYNEDTLFGTLQYTEDRLERETFTASESTLSRVDRSINQILTDGYKSGVGINEVSRQITERFDQLKTWEAKRIARTEIHSAQNQGIMKSYESLGVSYTQWMAAHDSRTRRSHMDIDEEIIPLGGTYSNKLKYPGDTSGPIEEWINCRCSNAPFVIPPGMAAPTFSPFRESDLVKVAEPDYGELLRKGRQLVKPKSVSVKPKTVKPVEGTAQAKPIEKPKVTTEEINDVLTGVLDEYGLSEKPKAKPKPQPKVVIEEPKPKVDVDNILAEVLDEYGLNKPKTQKKPKKTKAKSKPKEEPTITLKEHLRNELPSEFTDEALDYIVDKVKKRGNAKREYGQIFDYKTGRNTSPEFKGGKSAVNIKEEDWIKPPKQMTRAEQIDALSNPSKYKKSFVDKSDSLASIHNHPSDGSRAFSGADINITLTNKWEDFGLAISDKEIWCSEYKGTMNLIDAKEIEKKVDRLFNKSKKQAMKKVMAEYDDLPLKEKREIEAELLKDIFGDNLLDFFNNKNKDWGIKLRRVRYVE